MSTGLVPPDLRAIDHSLGSDLGVYSLEVYGLEVYSLGVYSLEV